MDSDSLYEQANTIRQGEITMPMYELTISETRHYTLRLEATSDEEAREYMTSPLLAMEQLTGAHYAILNVERAPYPPRT